MNRREFLSQSASGAAAFALAPAVFGGEAVLRQTTIPQRQLWHERPLRIYHPNARTYEMETLDVSRFVADCKATGAEAVVVSAGGIYAFYPSTVKYHYVSPISANRNLLGETVEAARRQSLRIIARIDFSKARAEVWRDHPEWFRLNATGKPFVTDGGEYYATCTLGGYRNEGFAFQVIQEMQKLYKVDGFHLNAGGFPTCYCATCVKAYGGPLPTDQKTTDPAVWRKYQEWRRDAHSQQLAGYYRVMRELDPESFFMAELFLGPGYHIPTLARFNSFSQLLFTSGETERARESRLLVPLTSDHGRALPGTRPLINIKMQMRDMQLSQSYMPRAEYFYSAYQALAHGAGLKLVTLAIPKNVLDARTLPDLNQVFAFMKQQQAVLDTTDLIAQLGLVWPDRAVLEEGATATGLQTEAMGLYTGLKMRHASLDVLYDGQLTAETLRRFDVVVIPTAVWLTDEQAAALAGYVQNGGKVVLFDQFSPGPGTATFAPMPRVLAELIGGTWTQNAKKARYIALTAQAPPASLKGTGPLPLTQPYREIKADPRAQVWYRDGHSDDAIPEDIEELTVGNDPIALFITAGKGSIFYVATALGQMIQKIGHGDYVTLLESMVYHGVTNPRPLATNAPSTVTATLGRWKGGRVVHLVNGTGPAPLDEVVPVGPIDVELSWTGRARVELAVPGQPVQTLASRQPQSGRLALTLPRLESYAQIVVRSV
jgi:Hypothetical glycosyl hydrolase 6